MTTELLVLRSVSVGLVVTSKKLICLNKKLTGISRELASDLRLFGGTCGIIISDERKRKEKKKEKRKGREKEEKRRRKVKFQAIALKLVFVQLTVGFAKVNKVFLMS